MIRMLLRALGWLFYNLERLRMRCLGTYKTSLCRCGENSYVGGGVSLSHPENITIGRNSYVNGGMLCASPGAKIVIGDDCLVSYAVHLRTDMHRHSDPDVPVNCQGHDEADIVLGDNVWVGYGAQVMSGVTVGSNSIVGAGAVITRDVPEGVVVAGVPAKVIKKR